jgi:hypothetical protein
MNCEEEETTLLRKRSKRCGFMAKNLERGRYSFSGAKAPRLNASGQSLIEDALRRSGSDPKNKRARRNYAQLMPALNEVLKERIALRKKE